MVDRNSAADLAKAGRLKQIQMVIALVHQQNKRALPITAGSALAVIVAFVIAGIIAHLTAFLIPVGVLLSSLVALILFGRYSQQAQYSAIEGQPGAAVAVMQSMRGEWTITPTVTANKNMDMVHRAVGRPGVILVGEGVPARLSALMATERKKTERVAHGVPVFEFQVGDGEGQVPVSKLQNKIMTLPRNLNPTAVSDLNYRLRALQPTIQMPKGPLPKGVRQPRMPKPR